MSIYKDICPIPVDQQPLNEYAQLKQLILFNWSTKPIHSFIKKLLAIFLFLTIITSSTSIIITHNEYTLFNLKRLLSATVFYEESGWYDGQLWIKPSNILIQDRLVGIYQVMPIIRTLKIIFLLNTCFFILQVYFLFIN